MYGLKSDMAMCKLTKSMVAHGTRCPHWDQVSLNNTKPNPSYLPARSTRLMLECFVVLVFLMFWLKFTVTMVWARLKPSIHLLTIGSPSHDYWFTGTLLNRIITAQWEGMGDVGSVRYEPALLLPCPTLRVLSYSNLSEISPLHF